MKSLRTRVWGKEKKRPYIQPHWPAAIKDLLEKSWDEDIKVRPTFQQIYKILREQCVGARDGDEEGLEHVRRRSTFVFTSKSGQHKANKAARGTVMEALEEFDYDEDEEEPEADEAGAA